MNKFQYTLDLIDRQIKLIWPMINYPEDITQGDLVEIYRDLKLVSLELKYLYDMKEYKFKLLSIEDLTMAGKCFTCINGNKEENEMCSTCDVDRCN